MEEEKKWGWYSPDLRSLPTFQPWLRPCCQMSNYYYYDLLRQLAAQIKKKHTYIELQQELTTKEQILNYTCNHTKL